MSKKAKGFLSRFLESQLFDFIYENITKIALYAILGYAVSLWGRRLELLSKFFNWLDKLNTYGIIQSILAFLIPVIAFGATAYGIVSLVQFYVKSRKPKEITRAKKEGVATPILIRRFSANLEKIKKDTTKKGWRPTGLALRFLDEIKSAPPFLGLRNEKPMISPANEQILTEFFIASIYMEKYQNVIRGGSYQIRPGDDEKIIAKKIYGDEKYDAYVPMRYKFPTGTFLTLPYVNLERPDSDEFIQRKINISKDIEEIKSMLESYHLVRDEAIPLLRMVYDAAQKTLEG